MRAGARPPARLGKAQMGPKSYIGKGTRPSRPAGKAVWDPPIREVRFAHGAQRKPRERQFCAAAQQCRSMFSK
jgi:hypothetical protein